MKRLVATAIGLFWWLVMIFETAALAQITVLGDDPLRFGDVVIGTSLERTLVIRNDGLEELRLMISRPATDHFVLVGLAEGEAFLDVALRPGAIYVLAVRCVPRRVGIIEETLMITANRGIRLLCNGIGPQLTFVTGDTLDFQEVEVGRTVDRDIIIRNDGTENLRGTVTAPSAPFSLVRGEGAFDIPPGRTYTVTVRCAPTSRGIFRFPLEIRNLNSALESTKTATLLCQGVGPEITLLWRRGDATTVLDSGPGSGPHLTIDFGTVSPNEARDISFEIRNNGERVLQGTVNSPSPNPPFSVVNSGGSFTLNPGAARTVTIRCHLRSPGGSTGTLTITAINDADESAKTIILACGRAIPDIDVSPMRVDFQGQERKRITIRNTGAAPLMLRRVSIVQNPAAFRLLNDLLPNPCKRFSCSIAPGQSIEFEVQARAHQSTTTGILRISSDDPDEPTVDILLQVMVGAPSSTDLDAESRRLEIRETKHALEFTLASAEVAELRVALYDLRGRKIVEASSRSGQLRLEMLDQQGKPLANGIYLYAITYQGADGSLLRDRVRKFVLLR